MKVRKCDRCGKFYLPNYHVTIAVDKWDGLNWDHLDLCNDCQDELEEWLNEKGDTNESKGCKRGGDVMNDPKESLWVYTNPFTDTMACSKCDYQIPTPEMRTPYCPWCGRKMINWDDDNTEPNDDNKE